MKRVWLGYKYLRGQDDGLLNTLMLCFKSQPLTILKFLLSLGNYKNEVMPMMDSNVLCNEIANVTGCCLSDVLDIQKEIYNDNKFMNELKNNMEAHRKGKALLIGFREFLYMMVRIAKPNIMIETGGYDGLGSALILLAMHNNNQGMLYTIDLPNPSLPTGCKPCWIVPDYLRDRFTLIEGKTSDYLEPLADKLKEIDMFYHDSWHSYVNMMFEYNIAWRVLRNGGYFMSEYLPKLNYAFIDFTKGKPVPNIVASDRQFIMRKL